MIASQRLKNEAKKNLKIIFILVVSLLLIVNEVTITNLFGFFEDDFRLKYTVDMTFNASVISVLLSVLDYFYQERKLKVVFSLNNKEDESSQITLLDSQYRDIELSIKLVGNSKNIKQNFCIVFPEWIDVQTRGNKLLTADDNTYYINLTPLIKDKKEVDLIERISFNIIANRGEKNEEQVKVQIIGNKFKNILMRIFIISNNSNPINIKRR